MASTKLVVGFSGGADSQACALWVRQRFPSEDIILMNSLAGRNEHPMTEAFVHWYSANVFPVTIVTPLIRDMGGIGTRGGQAKDRRDEFADEEELTFERLAYLKGRFPSRTAQFCTEFLKLAPQRRWCRENLEAQGIDYERYSGLRRDESQKRRHRVEREWDDYFDCYLNHPIVGWTKEEVFQSLAAAGEEVNPLYRMGFSRVGCAPCINSSKEDINQWASRSPDMIDKVREWERSVGRTFFAPCVPGLEINWIDEVVDWAKTSRGGRRYLLPMIEAEAEAGVCSSKYKLCE